MQEGVLTLKRGLFWVRAVGWGMVALAAAGVGWGADVHTNQLNRDPLVREAFDHFYNLDYPGAIERFRAIP